MATPTQEMTITYAGYGVGGSTGRILEAYHTFEKGDAVCAVQYSFIIPQTADSSALASACAVAEAAFTTPYAALTVVQSGSTILSLSHTASTGFNSHPKIIKTESLADSGRSRRYVVRIDFEMPATNFGTSYRQDSSVKLEYDESRRRRISIDGIYTANGSTGARAQYLASIGAYVSSIQTALGGTYDLLEDVATADDQDKILTFHRRYDELFTDRHDGQISVHYDNGRRRHVTISGSYTSIVAGTSARGIYAADIAAFVSTVLTALGGTYDLQDEKFEYDDNSTDKVCKYSRTYDELSTGRKEAEIVVTYDPNRKRHVTFTGTYVTVTAGGSALALYQSSIAAWVSATMTALGVSISELVSEEATTNDTDNYCKFRRVYDEIIFSEAGSSSDADIVKQELTISRAKTGPGDTPTAQRVVLLTMNYAAWIDKTLTTALTTKWDTIRAWMVNSLQNSYQTGTVAITAEKVDFDGPNNKITASLEFTIATYNILLNQIDVEDESTPGENFVGIWDGNEDSYLIHPGKAVKTRTVTKTYRRLAGGAVPGTTASLDVRPSSGAAGATDNSGPSVSGSTGEGGDDPFGLSRLKSRVVRRHQKKTKLRIGIAPNQFDVEDIAYVTVFRFYAATATSTGTGVTFTR